MLLTIYIKCQANLNFEAIVENLTFTAHHTLFFVEEVDLTYYTTAYTTPNVEFILLSEVRTLTDLTTIIEIDK